MPCWYQMRHDKGAIYVNGDSWEPGTHNTGIKGRILIACRDGPRWSLMAGMNATSRR